MFFFIFSGLLRYLNTLNLSHNYLEKIEDIDELKLLKSVTILDISHNRLESAEILEVLSANFFVFFFLLLMCKFLI